jgi:hypothetical protein
LESHDGGALETKVGLEVLCDFSDETLEGQFPDEQFGALLVPSDFSQGDSSGPVTMGFLDASGCWRGFSGSFCGELFSRCLSSGRLTGCLFCACHGLILIN